MKNIKAILIPLVMLLAGSSFAYDIATYERLGWDLRKSHERSNTAVFSKYTGDARVKTFLGVTVVETSLPPLLALLSDVDNMDKWVYKMGKTYVVERVSQTELYQYVVIKTPYPVKDRDLVVHTVASQDPETGVVKVQSNFVEGKVPEEDGLVRIPEGQNLFTLTPLEDGKKVMIEFETLVDPGGFIPAWAVNLLATGAPYYTLKKLHREVQKPKWQKTEAFQEFAWPKE